MPPTAALVKELAQALTACLRQPAVAGLNPTSVLNAASDLANAVAELLHAGGNLGDAIPHLKQAMGELPRFTAALERQWPSGGVGPATLPKWTIICTGACIALNTLLMLLHRKEMTLPEDGWTRLVAAAAVPLKLAPMLYGKVVTAAQLDAEVFHNLRLFLEKSAQPLQRLLEMTLVDDPPTMPRRVAKVLESTQFKAKPMCEWMRTACEAALAYMQATGSFTPPEFLAPTLRGILATDPLEAVKAEVGKRAAVQTAIVAFVEYSLALPAEEAAGLAGNGPRCAMLRDLAEAASADCLADGRTRSPSLLPAVANLAACAELQAQRGSPDQGSFLMACLELHAVLQHDFFERQRGEGRLQVTDDQLRAMGCLGGLPLLCTLSAEVAAAAPGSGGSGGFGPWCWREAARDWQVCQHRWLLALAPMFRRGIVDRLCDQQSCLAAWRSVEALLRMLPSLPRQPGSEQRPGRWTTEAQDVAAGGGLEACRQFSPAQHNGLLLAVAGLHVSQHLLRAVVADSAAAASPEAARAAFDLLSTVCRAVHNVAPALRPDGSVGAGAQSGLLIRNDSADLLRLLDAAAAAALRTSRQVLLTTTDAEQRAAAERRLECALLLYLPALEALLRLQPPVRDSEAADRRCQLWQDLLGQPELRQLWRALLGGVGIEACGLDAPWVLGVAMALAINDFAFQQAQTGLPLSLDEMAPLEAPLALLGTALKLVPEPTLARSLAQTPELLSQLNRAVAGLQAGIALDAQRGALNHLCLPPNGALAALWPVLASLAPHLPGLQANQRATLLQAVAPLPSPGTPLEYMGLKVAQTLLPKASDAAQQANQQPAAEPAAPEAAAALAVRRGCGNPRCASLAGASEGEARSARCSACRLLRYCGPACNKQDWRWHKLACKVLREAAT